MVQRVYYQVAEKDFSSLDIQNLHNYVALARIEVDART